MIIKYNDTDITSLLTSFSKTECFDENRIIGNAPSKNLNISVDNSTSIITQDNAGTAVISYQQDSSGDTEYYYIDQMPESYDGYVSLSMYDTMYRYNVLYVPTLTFYSYSGEGDKQTVTAVSHKISEIITDIEDQLGITVDTTDIPSAVLNREVTGINSSFTCRQHLAYIAELFGANVYCSDNRKVAFRQISTSSKMKSTDLYNYSKGSRFTITKIEWTDGTNDISSGTSGNTLYLRSDNPYLANDSGTQTLIDSLLTNFNSFVFYTSSGIEIDTADVSLGDVINVNDMYSIIATGITENYRGSNSTQIITCTFSDSIDVSALTNTEKTNILTSEVSEINADLINTNHLIAEEVDALEIKIGDASKTATNYITDIGSDGIKVMSSSNNDDYASITSDGMGVYDDGVQVAQFGTTTWLGKSDNKSITLDSNGDATITGAIDASSFKTKGKNFTLDASGDSISINVINEEGADDNVIKIIGSSDTTDGKILISPQSILLQPEAAYDDTYVILSADEGNDDIYLASSSHILLQNSETYLYGINSSLSYRALIGIDGNNHVKVGNNSSAVYIHGGNYSLHYVQNGTDKTVTTSSDRRIKRDIKDICDVDDFYSKLRPVQYSRIDWDGKKTYGFIAQEILNSTDDDLSMVDSELVDESLADYFNSKNPEEKLVENDTLYRVSYDEIVALNTHMIQKQQKEINDLKSEIDNLKLLISKLMEDK